MLYPQMTNAEHERLTNLMQAAEIANEARLEQAEQVDLPPMPAPDTPLVVPILPLRGMLLYPMSAVPLRSALPRSVKLIDDAVLAKQPIGIVASRFPEKMNPAPMRSFRSERLPTSCASSRRLMA